jgi:DNA-binding response OmpR family regulator
VRKNILVVDDDPELVELLRYNLSAVGYSVATASDGADALRKARSFKPDLILLDLMMPKLDGFAVCEILRRDTETSEIPIIILTAMSSQLARVAGLGAGAADFICKPFSPKILLERVRGILYAADCTETTQSCTAPVMPVLRRSFSPS